MPHHHANLLIGNPKKLVKKLLLMFQNDFGIQILSNPDLWVAEFEILKIEDARNLSDMQVRKSTGFNPINLQKIFVVSTLGITLEAQNALLKTFEEPAEGTFFYMIIPRESILLPTLLSRFQRMDLLNNDEQLTGSVDTKKFLSNPPAARLNMLKSIVTDKDKEQAIQFSGELIEIFHQYKGREKWNREDALVARELIKAESYLFDRSPSIKLIMEYIALRAPQLIEKK